MTRRRGARKSRTSMPARADGAPISRGFLRGAGMGGMVGSEVAAALGVTQQRVSQCEITALRALRRALQSPVSGIESIEVSGVPAARVFFTALGHALAEVELSKKYGITRAELRLFLEDQGITPEKYVR